MKLTLVQAEGADEFPLYNFINLMNKHRTDFRSITQGKGQSVVLDFYCESDVAIFFRDAARIFDGLVIKPDEVGELVLELY